MSIFKPKPKKPSGGYKPWHGYLLLFVIVASVVLGIVQRLTADQGEGKSELLPVIMSEETCALSGGRWNDCSSSCRSTPGVPCIDVCIPVCECTSDDSCPFGATCEDYVDSVGICLNS